ncbi:hypothetical protein [Paenibacillus methanolicus]|uniref:Uncharacterized protein n=1 Tax=Paenibacillus methanolicus TaxID=582686 RepID=A0A5S5C213_9BACL|nr:hypothetical protein [Paenibacillus methanolicus]TYP73337.1 hypothetical protein BCM02_107321 [Paenibacillus methanolicus]
MIVETFESLNARVQLRQIFSLPSYLDDYYFDPENRFLVSNGPLVLNRHLPLDWEELERLAPEGDRDIHGLVVLGDLTIEGNVLNTNMDSGPLLLVQGNVIARNILAGGSEIFINGDAHIREAVYGYYNHGSIEIAGTLHAGLIVMDDHMYNIKIDSTKVPAQYLDADFSDGSDDLKALSTILRQEIDSLEGLRNLILEGDDILKPEAQNLLK